MLTRPKTLRILGQKVRVTYHLELPDGDLGGFDEQTMTISVVEDDNWKSHLLHELLHAVIFVSGISEMLSQDLEESLVRALEHGLRPFMEIT